MPLLTVSAFALALSVAAYEPDYTHRPLVHQVICTRNKGTAFRIGPTTFASVAHVTDNDGCTIDGHAITAVADRDKDFSVVTVPTYRRGGAMRINCGGFKKNEWYWASGYARGYLWQQTVRILGIGQQYGGLDILYGFPTVIPGMSGGPVMNAAGEVVGTVNRYSPWAPYSMSQPLSETSLCKRWIA